VNNFIDSFHSRGSVEKQIHIKDERHAKSKDTKTFKKSRNSYVKSSRTKNEINFYDESFSSTKKKPNNEKTRKSKNTMRHSKLKINIKENKDPLSEFTPPPIVQTHLSASNLIQSQIYNNQPPDMRHNLLERMSRVESIISHSKSFESKNPSTTKNDYNYQYAKDYSPMYFNRNSVSPVPSNNRANM
jgi:hypothetical protein